MLTLASSVLCSRKMSSVFCHATGSTSGTAQTQRPALAGTSASSSSSVFSLNETCAASAMRSVAPDAHASGSSSFQTSVKFLPLCVCGV